MKAKRVINKISTDFIGAHEIKVVSRMYGKHTFVRLGLLPIFQLLN